MSTARTMIAHDGEHGSQTNSLSLTRGRPTYNRFGEQLAQSVLIGLEFLVAGDICRTVAVTPTLENVAILTPKSAEDGLGSAPHRQSQRFVSLVRFGEAQQTAPSCNGSPKRVNPHHCLARQSSKMSTTR